jgi:hypothetical protein
VAAGGSASLIFSLWQPWFGFRIPGLIIQQAEQTAHSFGVLAPAVSRAAQVAQRLGTVHVNSWQLLTTTPAVLLVIGVVAGGLSALALFGHAAGVARVVAGAAAIAVAVAVYRIAKPPGASGLLAPAWGLELALGSAVAVLAGGLLAVGADNQVPDTFVPATITLSGDPDPGAWPTPPSVAPPSP